jgi:membrane fusion protein (multidrug efflux system)
MNDAEIPAKSRRSGFGLRAILLVVLPALVVAASLAFYLQGGRYISTDNAYIAAQKVVVTPEVEGKIVAISVREGDSVKVGQELLTIDPTTYRIAVTQAEAQLARVNSDFVLDKTSLASLERQIELGQQTLTLRQADAARKAELLGNRSGSRAEADNAEIGVTSARVQLEQLQNQKSALLNQLLGNPDLPLDAFLPYIQAQASLERARHDLDRTVLRAPIAGIATQVSSIQMGRYLEAGNAVFSILGSRRTPRKRISPGLSPARPSPSVWTPIRAASGTVGSDRSAQARVRSSQSCRRRTRAEIGSRSSSVFLCASNSKAPRTWKTCARE